MLRRRRNAEVYQYSMTNLRRRGHCDHFCPLAAMPAMHAASNMAAKYHRHIECNVMCAPACNVYAY